MLLEQAADRIPELVPLRHERMLASPFGFFRGAAALMAADLVRARPTPGSRSNCAATRICRTSAASPHPTASSSSTSTTSTRPRRGPWEWDVKRLAASFEVAGRELGLDDATRRGHRGGRGELVPDRDARFATMRNLELWYARLDVARILGHAGDRVSAKERPRSSGAWRARGRRTTCAR